MLRTLTNLFILPLVYKTYKQALFKDMMIFIYTFIVSFLFHLQENMNKVIIMPYWNWLILDHYGAMIAVIVICCHVAGYNNDRKMTSIYIFSCFDIMLNLWILYIRDGKILDIKNLIEGFIAFTIIIANYHNIKLSFIEKIYFIGSYIAILLGVRLLPFAIEITHSIWHITVFLNTYLLYYRIEINSSNTEVENMPIRHLFV